MDSLFKIEQDLDSLFENIEENGGEVTDEELSKIEIKQEELLCKLDSYYKAILKWKNDYNACKEEKQRINNVQKRYNNRIDYLTKSIIQSIEKFGLYGKTNKYIELPTVRLSLRKSESVEVDIHRVSQFIYILINVIQSAYKAGYLYAGENVDYEGLLSVINAEYKAYYGENSEPFTISDLCNLEIKVSCTTNIIDLYNTKSCLLGTIANSPISLVVEPEIDKPKLNSAIKCRDERITFAKIECNNNLQIK